MTKNKAFFGIAALFAVLLSTPADAAGPSAADILSDFGGRTGQTYAITGIDGAVAVCPLGKTGFVPVMKTPHSFRSQDILFLYPLTSITVALDSRTSLVINDEACLTLADIFSGRKTLHAIKKDGPGGAVTIVINPTPPTIYEKRTIFPCVTDIHVFEGRVWVAELDMYGNIVKREVSLSAGQSMTSSGVVGGGGEAVAAPPSPPPATQPTTEKAAESPPSLSWSASYDGSFGGDAGEGVCTDSNNNIIITGYTEVAGGYDFLTIKYDGNSGAELWRRTYDITVGDGGNAVAVDSQDNVIVAGHSGTNIAILKYSKSGALLVPPSPILYGPVPLVTYLPSSLAIDSNDNIIVTGFGNGGGEDHYITLKYGPDGGVPLVMAYAQGPTADRPNKVRVDGNDNIIVTGTVDTTGTPHVSTIKYTSSGSVVSGWPKTRTATGTGRTLIIDSQNNVFVEETGMSLIKYTPSGNEISDINIGPGSDFNILALLTDGGWWRGTSITFGNMMRKYSADMTSILWSTSFQSDATMEDQCVDLNGNYILTGYVSSGATTNALTLKFTLSTGSTLTKKVNRKEAVIGDILTYSIIVHNPKPGVMTGITLHDRLPPGFTYVKGSSVYDGARISDPTGSRTLTYNLGGLLANAQKTLSYQLIVGAGCIPGEYYNEATATGTFGGTYTFNTTHAIVKVVLDPILQKGTIVGTVYWDHNENGIQEKGEEGIQGVKVYLEDGTSVATDKYGRYHFQGVNPGTHTVKIDKSSIKERL